MKYLEASALESDAGMSRQDNRWLARCRRDAKLET